MKNKFLILTLSALFLSSCRGSHEIALKSADKDLILKTANEHYANKKWTKALELYDRLTKLVAGTDDAAEVAYKSAYSNYYDKNYRLAGHQFKNFSVVYAKDSRAEDAAYMSAYCYYKGSMDYKLDQTNTDTAINEMQSFLNNYPDSEKAKDMDKLIDELTAKLELKSYENARQYFKMGEYKAASVSFENTLEDFPSTKLRMKIYDYMIKSKYELAVHSVYDLKKERIEEAIAFTKQLEREVPNTSTAKEATVYREKLLKEKESFAILEKETNERKAEYEAKVKLEEQKAKEKEEHKAEEKKQRKNKEV